MICAAFGQVVLPIGASLWLMWTHSVERIEWREYWGQDGAQLVLRAASVSGSGAGMEPGENAIWRDGRWHWEPDYRLPELRLALSGYTGGGWQICAADETDSPCQTIPESADLLILRLCGNQ